ncbi:MAG TPA: ABC transporter ATP-binding protein [Victivallales bacterium]|nr:ABC transporter ATP-binding protein [Victivallales bacterium]
MHSLEVKNLSFSYIAAYVSSKVLNNISFNLSKGSCLKINGKNGSGKTTLAYCLAGLIPKHIKGKLGGEILINKTNIRDIPLPKLTDKIGVVFKDPETQLLMPTVEYELAFPLENRGIPRDEITDRIYSLADFLKIRHLLKRNTSHLSLGEKQLIVLAATLITNPDFLVLDEALSMLDKCSTKRFLSHIKELKENMKSVIIIDHVNDYEEITDRVIKLDNGEIVSEKYFNNKVFTI